MLTTTTREAYEFMREWGGYLVGRNAEIALRLARAETLLHEAVDEDVASVVWDNDDIPYDIDGYTNDEIREKFDTNEWCGPYVCLLRVRDETVASLAGIVFGSQDLGDPYRRVVEAELASEADDEIRQALGDARDARTCPECEQATMREDDHVWVCPSCGYETSDPD